ncbi:MAG: GNAT family N-acetyltransferase [Candidatus Marinimicrobia bacterium]|jgi:predicted acetyltransferase|nr:GNAT family N-acetyltransferase [Candidatus Neomarinimicrobiota bacterium]MBT3629980.1 GNAT family N-acetyltransferase [Candidatus Neomarinimicrobiota bacterium]MBT3823984.1 GNAT family N-acetyltransferase [Candidatus Neomarinimicrobiota bacterium]MBT4131590.1 GNAT family N-acetyltransferase [Candidatus Neomarinimicrobiota bacterium]MBT4294386.1 GNAT family N-acetyltransferase [Candidatus Neomarinimicrobiota bacterium]
MYTFRKYDHDKDLDAAKRIWHEVQWIDDEAGEKSLDVFLKKGRSLVAELRGSAECLVTANPGKLRYLNEDLALSIVTSVTTSRIARKQGLAKKLTARLIAEEAEAGALVSTLGIFEQGFYDQLGYGSGSYEHWMSFDPADIAIDKKIRPPRRLNGADWKLMYQALQNRRQHHGGVTLLAEHLLQAEMGWSKKSFGLGYADGPHGELTHYFWGTSKDENGPLIIYSMAFQTNEQFIELMALIKSQGDQVRLVKMREPAGIQLQDLVQAPFRSRIVTEKSKFEHINRASAYWQTRICNLEACIAATHLNSRSLRFNLELSDPLEKIVNPEMAWRGCAGRYTIELGPTSKVTSGFNEGLPTLVADIGTFTRLWLGVRPATGLLVTGNLSGPETLIKDLDEVLCLPNPHPDWDY